MGSHPPPVVPDAEALTRQAAAHRGEGRFTDAARDLEAALSVDPRNLEALDMLGLVREALRQPTAAADCYRKALAIDPAYVPSLNNLADLMRTTGQLDRSRELINRALAAQPGNGVALNNLGRLLHRQGRVAEALEEYARAHDALPQAPAILVNWGNALHDVNRLDEARKRYEEAIRLAPAMADAHYGRAHLNLREGRFAEGWHGFEARFATQALAGVRVPPRLPRLDASNLASAKRVAIWSEQGLGDQILYSTLLPELARRGLHAVVEVDPRMVTAYRRSLSAFEFVPRGEWEAFSTCDHQIPIASLPRLFRRNAESFDAQPRELLTADAARVEEIRSRLGAARGIAIAWRSPQTGEREWLAERKSAPLETLAALASVPGIRLLDVQFGDVATERRGFDERHPGMLGRIPGLDTTNDLEGVLAALAACELVVTTSNTVAHLAGASGRPTLLIYLEGRAPFHYWVPRPDGRSLWYPSVEILTDPGWTRWPDAMPAVLSRLSRGVEGTR